jgi:plasmid stabilization system protein ParE
MNSSLRFTHAAEIDYYDSLRWYEERQLGLGARFEEAIDRAMLQIRKSPEAFSGPRVFIEGLTLRRFVVQRFPFLIFYVAKDFEVIVVAVFHTSRNPEEIKERKLS